MMPENLFSLYKDHFIPIYSDFVSLTATKPEQVLIEESNILSHVAQFHNKEELSEEARNENLKKAKNHLVRASLDLHKLVWAELKGKIEPNIKCDIKRLCFKKDESEVLKKYSLFMKRAKEARSFEMKNIGNDPIQSVQYYEAVNQIGFELLDSLDEIKLSDVVKSINSKKRTYTIKELIFSIIVSVTATAICFCIGLS